MRFRYDHTRTALATETQVGLALRDLASTARTCAAKTGMDLSLRGTLGLSAQIEITSRDILVRGWSCDVDPGEKAARVVAAVCGCVVDSIPGELALQLPDGLADEDLADYTGDFSLRL